MPGYAIEPWFSLFGPSRTPAEVADVLARALADALRSDSVRSQFAAQGYEPLELSPKALRDLIESETTRFRRVLDGTGMRISR
jgi:tripartite-type tricarboxylate transporter receptor subunit TctC